MERTRRTKATVVPIDLDACPRATFVSPHSFASMPQKGPSGEPRTEEETAAFGRALGVMGRLYASVAGTAVIQFKEIPQPPTWYQDVYNDRPYHERGWTTFEEGASLVVMAHLSAAERQAADRGKRLPERFEHAQRCRAKVVDISGGSSNAREITEEPEQLLERTIDAIADAKFTGKVRTSLSARLPFLGVPRSSACLHVEHPSARNGRAISRWSSACCTSSSGTLRWPSSRHKRTLSPWP